MKMNVYSLKDEVDQFGALMCFPNDASAMRAIRNAYDTPGSIYQTSPADFTLYCVGQFDTKSGEFDNSLTARRICSCSDFREV